MVAICCGVQPASEQGHRGSPEVMEMEFYGISNTGQGDGFQPCLSHYSVPELADG
jgi:hypothetical protein